MKDYQDYLDSNLPIDVRVEILLSKMSLKEKVAQLGAVGPVKIMEDGEISEEKMEQLIKDGIGQITRIAGASALSPQKAAEASNKVQEYLENNTRLQIPALIHEECLSGYMGKGGTTFPQSIGMASSWEPELMEEVTTVIRKQMRAMGSHLGLSPLADVARDIRWGRVEETFGEDQYLVAAMVSAYTRGLQGDDPAQGIYATLKHFAGHGDLEGGRNHAPVNISERELRENHLFPYEAAIRTSGAMSVMNAYHDIDGVPCASSRKLLTDILRGEWEFDGIVVSDYMSIEMLSSAHKVARDKKEAGVLALKAGLDIELPESDCYGDNLIEAVEEGLISESVIDESVRRHLRAKFRLGIFDNRYVDTDDVNAVFETPSQRELARKTARKSMVLLKNEDNLLPLSKDLESIAVIGPSADSTRNLLGDYAYSAHVDSKEDAVDIVSILDGIKNKLSEKTEIKFAKGCSIMGDDRSDFAEAVKAAEEAEVAVVVVGGKSGLSGMGENENSGEDDVVDFDNVAFSSELQHTTDTAGEHHDRTDLQLPGIQRELLQAIYETGTPVVAVLVNGRPLSIKWTAENIPAILETWLPGEEGGNAAADILFGDYNPGGKLPISIPKNVGQIPINYNRKFMSHNRDYVFEDNRPLYPFGYGLSYTKFEYSDFKISESELEGASDLTIEVTVENIGDTAGDEVVQLYINDKYASRTRPIKELKGFKRISLNPGQKKVVKFVLSTEQLAFYDKDMNLVVEKGDFKIMVGSSSAEIYLTETFTITDTFELTGYRKYFTSVEADNSF